MRYWVERKTSTWDGWTGWWVIGPVGPVCRAISREVASETARLLNELRGR